MALVTDEALSRAFHAVYDPILKKEAAQVICDISRSTHQPSTPNPMPRFHLLRFWR